MNNIYYYDTKERLKGINTNRYLSKVIEQLETIDSITDYDTFKKAVLEYKAFVKKRNRVFSTAQYGVEGLLYGHRKAFFEYAGYEQQKDKRFCLPYFEHGINWQEQYLKTYSHNMLHSFVFQGPYKNQMLNKECPWHPVYNIGPYVCYAKSYYPQDKIQEMKRSYGKTLLLYPLHTCEGATADVDRKEFVRLTMDKFKNQCSTIMISVYWNDVDDPLYDAFQAEGAMLVSAGYRQDQNFIRRLRSMVELSDFTAGNHIGTHIGYCMALEKPHVIFNMNAQVNESFRILSEKEEKTYNNTLQAFYSAFGSLTPNETEKQLQERLFEKFWGGQLCFKSVNKAREIIDVSTKLIHLSHGNMGKFQSILKSAVCCRSGLSDFTNAEIELLRGTVGYYEE